MTTITLQDIKTKGAKSIPDDRPVWLIVNSKVKSVMVPQDMYEEFVEAMEELEDIRAIEESKNEQTVSLENAFAFRTKKR